MKLVKHMKKIFSILLIILISISFVLPSVVYAGGAGDDATRTRRTVAAGEGAESYEQAGCPLGTEVTQDLYGALKIFKILAPLLVIGFTVAEVVKSIAQGDINNELKQLYKKFSKRIMYAVILFFLPILVDQVFQIANVWDSNGGCDFGITDSASGNNSTNTQTNMDCSSRGLDTCKENSICTIHDGICKRTCSSYSMSTCPSDRCEVKAGACATK